MCVGVADDDGCEKGADAGAGAGGGKGGSEGDQRSAASSASECRGSSIGQRSTACERSNGFEATVASYCQLGVKLSWSGKAACSCQACIQRSADSSPVGPNDPDACNRSTARKRSTSDRGSASRTPLHDNPVESSRSARTWEYCNCPASASHPDLCCPAYGTTGSVRPPNHTGIPHAAIPRSSSLARLKPRSPAGFPAQRVSSSTRLRRSAPASTSAQRLPASNNGRLAHSTWAVSPERPTSSSCDCIQGFHLTT